MGELLLTSTRCFWTVVLEKTLESPLDCKEIQPVHPKGDQSWVIIGRSDVEAETAIFWPPDVKIWLIGKDPVTVAESCPILCSLTDCSMPVHHQLPEFTQIHVHLFGDAIQSLHPLSFPSPPPFNVSQHQGLFKWVSSLHQVVKVLEFQLQHQSFQWIFRADFL